MVPIVEPEILTTGDYDINQALQTHQEVLSILFRAFNEHHVYLEGMLLKPAMALPGIKYAKKYTPQVSFDVFRWDETRCVLRILISFFFSWIKKNAHIKTHSSLTKNTRRRCRSMYFDGMKRVVFSCGLLFLFFFMVYQKNAHIKTHPSLTRNRE